jgi:hypothetical protein
MVLRRVDCGLPRFRGFLTQAARSRRGSLFICILASLPIQRRDLLVRKMRISGTSEYHTFYPKNIRQDSPSVRSIIFCNFHAQKKKWKNIIIIDQNKALLILLL